jgi:hypothetical protein
MVTIADFILVPVDWRVLLPDRPHIPRLSEAERSSVRDSPAPRSAQRAQYGRVRRREAGVVKLQLITRLGPDCVA